MKKRITLIESMIAIAIVLAIFLVPLLIPPAARAAGNSGVWPVQLAPDNTFSGAADGGVSLFVLDMTTKNNYSGNIIGQFTGVTLSGTTPLAGPSGATLWAPGFSTGISVYYAPLTFNPLTGATPNPTTASVSPYHLANWTLITATGGTLRSGNSYYAFDIPVDPAAPYVGLQLVFNGASQFAYGLRYATTGNVRADVINQPAYRVASAIGPLIPGLPWRQPDLYLDAIARRWAIYEEWLA